MSTPTNPLRLRLEAATEDIPQHDLESERKKISNLPDAELEQLEHAISAYVTKKETYLKSNASTESALLALKDSVEEERKKHRSTTEKLGSEYGGKAGKIAEQTINRGSALAYNEWLKLQDPTQSTGYKALKLFGLAWGAYGLYRMAKWAWGKRGGSGLWRILRFTGLTAGAGLVINILGSEQEKEALKKPPLAPTVVPGLSLKIAGTNIDIIEQKTPAAAERLLRVGTSTYRATSSGVNLGSLIQKIHETPDEFHVEGPSLLGIPTGGYIERSELERIVKILSKGSSTDLTVTYFDKPKTDPARKASQKSVRCEKQ